MNKQPLISVIMSAYNSEKTIESSVSSIINQSYKNFEIMILDDFSQDGTYNIIDNIKKDFNNIKLFKNNKNLGLTKSLNILLKESKGEFIARQDSDDISYSYRFEKQIEYILSKKLDGCSSRAKIMKTDKVIPNFSYYIPKKFLLNFKNPFVHGSLMIKKNVIMDVGMYNENFYYSQDYKLMRDLSVNNYTVKIMKDVLYELNMQDNISSIFTEEQKYFADCVRKNKNPKASVSE